MMEAWVYGVIGAGAVIILACLLFIVYQVFSLFYHGMHKSILPFYCTKVEESSDYKETKKGRVQSFTYTEIEAFCEGFSNLVGEGSTCYIYKGILLDGTEIAVKRFKDMVQDLPYTERKFQYQVELLSQVHHPNLVSIIGYCEERNSRMLVLQYAPNGTLSENLHGGEQLSWRQRMRIALGTAYGLSYLHYSCNPPLFFHGKFSSLNILLTEDYAAKITGIEKMSEKALELDLKPDKERVVQVQTQRVESGRAADVYAFGTLLLELISGRQASNQSILTLVDSAKQYLQCNDKMTDIADPTLKNIIQRELNAICEIACLCILQEVETRPNMEAVILMLVEALGIGSETAAPITNLITLRGLVENV
ncbi:protein MALE DISCOVERER 1 [Cryptomeria japonica]|uniref:protein MALE DISCOVERER 1 n=1 Tax=Cryptomeria japonica TaxID=3369 RepID=UPI0025AC3194|nr:protein MALE DISCOVERER 1 [Cryptomeria japonica]XP_059074505.1 protein MALE DISCOVERER 1 [Cryptomeria japonica]XP_059074506.1 protein MALE DISCOVERER 1 [Cryptomeria japonica]XP_059074507.1 protein MALE DISCOVERER 1 [Cryptomeria japonica]